jgi:hypothetical protein
MAQFKTVLDIVSRASMEIGITQRPVSSVVSSPDQDITQMRELLYAVADEVLYEEPYNSVLGDGNWLFANNAVFKDHITSDDDRVAFDGRLAINGLKWRFLKAKGLEFGEEQRDFITRMNKIAGRHNGKVLDLDTEWSVAQ